MLQKRYIATFYSHFGAIRFKRLLKDTGIEAKVMPVPRQLSSSCGTCVSFVSEGNDKEFPHSEEMEMIVEAIEDGYREIFRAKDS